MSNNNNTVSTAHLTVLDRRIVPLLDNPDETASQKNTKLNKQGGEHSSTIITPRLERLHRLHGTSLLSDAARLLDMGASTYATSCTLFHRYFHQVSLLDQDVWSIAMACLLLATKIEEEQGKVPYTLSQIATVFCHLYRKRLLFLLPDDTSSSSSSNNENNNKNNETNVNANDNKTNCDTNASTTTTTTTNASSSTTVPTTLSMILKHASSSFSSSSLTGVIATISPMAETWTTSEKHSRLAQVPLPSKLGPIHQEWITQLSKMEQIVLRQLGFTLYWIPDSHPHKFILYFVKVLEIDNAQFAQRAWNYCNDSCRLDLCIRFASEVIACSAIYLAARDFDVLLPTSPRPWWEVFMGPNKSHELAVVVNAILGLCVNANVLTRKAETTIITSGGDKNGNDDDNIVSINSDKTRNDKLDLKTSELDMLIANHGFVVSLVGKGGRNGDGGSFNDPDSFVWDHQMDLMTTTKFE